MKYDRFRELPFDEEEAPKKTEYESDILVIGGGYAGLSAAVTARKAGLSVVLVDKGRPGYSGQSPHACCTRFFDESMGDERETEENLYIHNGEFLANRNWLDAWFKDSKSVYELYTELGLTEQYPDANTTGFADRDDYFGYRDLVGDRLRHKRFLPALVKNGVTVVERTMIYDIVEKDGRVIGAVGFDVPTGVPVVFNAKATIMCMGGGVYKPAGWPTGGCSFDAIAIGYKHGLPIIGQEFEDYHTARPDAPSNAWWKEAFPYLQNMMINGGEVRAENLKDLTRAQRPFMESVVEGLEPFASDVPSWHPPVWQNIHPEDVRNNRKDSDEPKNVGSGVYGVAPGFPVHSVSGIFCGCDDSHGYTGLPGLYCAGDGCNGGPVGGSTYAARAGFTSNFFGVQGKRSGEAAAEYVKNGEAKLEKIDGETVSTLVNEFTEPLYRKKGYDVLWALDCLQGFMTPFWTLLAKSEEHLNAALVNVVYMRDHVVPKVIAMNAHDLRYCEELKHKVLEAEMKLRVSLERKESRGNHFRRDYPYRDDKLGLCYFAAIKRTDGTMGIDRIEIPDDWKGDLNEPYFERYTARFPGEEEALKERGLM